MLGINRTLASWYLGLLVGVVGWRTIRVKGQALVKTNVQHSDITNGCHHYLGEDYGEFEPSTNAEVQELVDLLQLYRPLLSGDVWIQSVYNSTTRRLWEAFSWREEVVDLSLWFTSGGDRYEPDTAQENCTILRKFYGDDLPSETGKYMLGTALCSQTTAWFLCAEIQTDQTPLTTETTARADSPSTASLQTGGLAVDHVTMASGAHQETVSTEGGYGSSTSFPELETTSSARAAQDKTTSLLINETVTSSPLSQNTSQPNPDSSSSLSLDENTSIQTVETSRPTLTTENTSIQTVETSRPTLTTGNIWQALEETSTSLSTNKTSTFQLLSENTTSPSLSPIRSANESLVTGTTNGPLGTGPTPTTTIGHVTETVESTRIADTSKYDQGGSTSGIAQDTSTFGTRQESTTSTYVGGANTAVIETSNRSTPDTVQGISSSVAVQEPSTLGIGYSTSDSLETTPIDTSSVGEDKGTTTRTVRGGGGRWLERQTVPVNVCPCQCPNNTHIHTQLSGDAVLHKTYQLQRNLSLDHDALSTSVRKKTSAEDRRFWSQFYGCIAIIVLVVTFGVLIYSDTSIGCAQIWQAKGPEVNRKSVDQSSSTVQLDLELDDLSISSWKEEISTNDDSSMTSEICTFGISYTSPNNAKCSDPVLS